MRESSILVSGAFFLSLLKSFAKILKYEWSFLALYRDIVSILVTSLNKLFS